MLEQYLRALRAEGKSDKTISTYRTQISRFLNWLKEQGDADPLKITSIDAVEYRGHLQNVLGHKPSSVSLALASIETFCKWMQSEGYRDHNPLEKVKRPAQVKDAPKWLGKNEKYRVIRTALNENDRRNTAIILTMLMTGVRVSELVNLKPTDIVISERKGTLTVRGKGNKTRTIPMPSDLRNCLGEYLVEERAAAEWLFDSQRGDQISPKGVQHLCATIGEKAKVDGLTPHVLRHTFCHDLVAQGVNVFLVAKLAGHVKIETTMIYAQPGEEELQAAVEKLGFT
jgi:site-specific recombinase XerD